MHSKRRETEIGSVCEKRNWIKQRKKTGEERGAKRVTKNRKFIAQIINKILNYLKLLSAKFLYKVLIS